MDHPRLYAAPREMHAGQPTIVPHRAPSSLIEKGASTVNAEATNALPSEIDRSAQLEEPRRQHRRRHQPRTAGRERLVVGEDRIRVEQVVDVDAEGAPRS